MTAAVRAAPPARHVVLGSAAAALAVLIGLVTTRWTPLRSLDLSVLRGLNDRTAPHPALVHAWKVVSEIGQPFTFQVLAVLTAVVLWRRGRVPTAVFTAVTVPGAGLLSTVVKILVGRDRPTPPDSVAHAGGASFPSGHALSSLVAVAVLLVLVAPHLRGGRRVAVAAAGVLVAALIAFSRLALGVHYASDVLGGWLLAVIWTTAALIVLDRFSDRPPRAPARPSPGPPP